MSESIPADDADVQAASNYYRSISDSAIQEKFHNLDSPADLDGFLQAVTSNNSQNFVLDFGDDAAFVGFDLFTSSVAALLDAERPEVLNVRWINIWAPQHKKETLELLARRYDFSPRLLALMCSDPYQRRTSSLSSRPSKQSRRSRRSTRRSPTPSAETEVEKGLDELSELSSVSSYDSVTGGNLYRIIDDLWHYASVDFGRSYVCIGYNSLYGTKSTNESTTDGMLPHCTRVWTWLVLCEDATVLSINEDPFPFAGDILNPQQQRILTETRRNTLNVFRSLSKVHGSSLLAHNPMTLLPLRTRLGSTPEETAHRASDAPSGLFFYLFENWHNSYTLVTRKESRYGVELAALRAEMFIAPKLCHIDRLDGVGRELGVLRRHYQGYTRIIDRLLEPRKVTSASLQNSHVVSEASQLSLLTVRPVVLERDSMLGVSLSSATIARFRRLKDLIELYALSEVDEYLKQKDSLVAMNFSLIAIKESLDVEKLTRVTLLLTKATILFLPVSLMSAYFSIGLRSTGYTVTEYWTSFATILFCSFIALFVFGVSSGSVQTAVFFEGMWHGMRGAGEWMIRRMRSSL